MEPGKSSLSGVAGIETRVRDAVSLLVTHRLDELAIEGLELLAELQRAHGLAPGTSDRTTIVTKLIGFHTRALMALAEKLNEKETKT